MDVNGGSPPSAVGFLASQGSHPHLLAAQFSHWQNWAAETFQNQLSYPMLAYFRSPHKNQSWLASICRHAMIDLESIFNTRPLHAPERLNEEQFHAVQEYLVRSGAPVDMQRLAHADLHRRREQYEPQAQSLGHYFMVEMPPWLPGNSQDNWQTEGDAHENQHAVSEPFTSPT